MKGLLAERVEERRDLRVGLLMEEEEKKERIEKKEENMEDVGLKELSKKLKEFAKERDWEQYHSPRNLLLAMVRAS